MKLSLQRFEFTEQSTIGRLSVNGEGFCVTLEDKDRRLEFGGEKVYGKTAIPRGTYKVVIDFSNRFKRELPRLLNVPGFEGIRIHPGNAPEDTEGCILIGANWRKDWVTDSRATFNKLFQRLEIAYDNGEEIEIEVL